MSREKHFFRFHLLVLRFVASIILLIFSPRIVSLLLGWDSLGVTSFLLVIYFQNSKSLRAGILTALRNRIGDCLLLVSIAFIRAEVLWSPILLSSWAYSAPVLGVLILRASLTKRAQMPFSAWLPAAIAAPTPVSSLVHSSTLVTAGVYILCRYHSWALSMGLGSTLLSVGMSTVLLAGRTALFENDIKKIIALSTLSQLGLIIGTLGLGLPQLAFFHLLTHAFVKALLFITVGNIIHLSDRFQDCRKVGIDLWVSNPTIGFCLLANFSLIGLPFLAGFYSKDLIIETPLQSKTCLSSPLLFYLSTAITAAYAVRFILSVLVRTPQSPKALWAEDYCLKILTSNLTLAPLAITRGAIISWTLFPWLSVNIMPKGVKVFIIVSIFIGIGLGGIWWPKTQPNSDNSLKWRWGAIWGLPFSSSPWFSAYSLGTSSLSRKWDLSWLSFISLVTSHSISKRSPWHNFLPPFKPQELLFISVTLMALIVW